MFRAYAFVDLCLYVFKRSHLLFYSFLLFSALLYLFTGTRGLETLFPAPHAPDRERVYDPDPDTNIPCCFASPQPGGGGGYC